MHILVTGGAGKVGLAVVRWLLAHGHNLRVLDLSAETIQEGVDYRRCDITDYSSLLPHLDGMDRIIHLAAIPTPMMAPAPELFHINVAGTFNVFQAAAEAGIRRIASASSINTLGYNFGVRPFKLSYFPIDEDRKSVV